MSKLTKNQKTILKTIKRQFKNWNIDKTNKPIVFKDGIYKTNDPKEIELLNSFIKNGLFKDYLQPETLSKEVLNDLTNPEKRNFTVGEIVDKVVALSEGKLEFDLPKKEYTLEDMRKFFTQGATLFNIPNTNTMNTINDAFEDYINSLKQ